MKEVKVTGSGLLGASSTAFRASFCLKDDIMTFW